MDYLPNQENENSSDMEENEAMPQAEKKWGKSYSLSEVPLPEDYDVPRDAFTPGVMRKISAPGVKAVFLSTAERSIVALCIFDDLKHNVKKVHCTGKEYDTIASKLLKAYPALKAGMEFRTAQSFWVNVIREKFRNERKKRNRDLMLAAVRTEPPKKKLFGAKNSPPEAEASVESEASIKAHIVAMKDAAKKGAKRDDRMQLTYIHRRELLKSSSIKSVLETYPLLGQKEELHDEFQRTTGHKLDKMREEMTTPFCRAILQHVCPEADVPDGDEKIIEKAVLKLPSLFKEGLKDILVLSTATEVNPQCPYVVPDKKTRSFSIVLGNTTLCTNIAHILDAFALNYCCYSVYNLKFNKKLRLTLNFISQLVTGSCKAKSALSMLYQLKACSVNE